MWAARRISLYSPARESGCNEGIFCLFLTPTPAAISARSTSEGARGWRALVARDLLDREHVGVRTASPTAINTVPVAVDDSYTVAERGVPSLAVNWWDLDWTRRQQITFWGNTGAGTQTLIDFPVLVTLNSGNIDYAQTQNDGGDLRFFDADGTALAYEIERWNEAGTSTSR
jgi:hypothetical protein